MWFLMFVNCSDWPDIANHKQINETYVRIETHRLSPESLADLLNIFSFYLPHYDQKSFLNSAKREKIDSI